MVQTDKYAFHYNRLISASIHIKMKRSSTEVIFQSKVWVSINPQTLEDKKLTSKNGGRLNVHVVMGKVNCHSTCTMKFQNRQSSYGYRKLQLLFPYQTNIASIKLAAQVASDVFLVFFYSLQLVSILFYFSNIFDFMQTIKKDKMYFL